MNLVKKVKKIAHHRNGVCGKSFYVVLFTSQERNIMLGILTGDTGECFVLDVDLLCQETIEFGENSWRGDRFETELKNAINDYENDRKQA